MHKNLKTPAVECLKLFPAKQYFLKWIPAPENCKNQEINRVKYGCSVQCAVCTLFPKVTTYIG